ncbi:DUF1627 domain-containing protein, partial [Escherichia coli]
LAPTSEHHFSPCAALRELNKHRDIVRQITDSSRRVVSEK